MAILTAPKEIAFDSTSASSGAAIFQDASAVSIAVTFSGSKDTANLKLRGSFDDHGNILGLNSGTYTLSGAQFDLSFTDQDIRAAVDWSGGSIRVDRLWSVLLSGYRLARAAENLTVDDLTLTDGKDTLYGFERLGFTDFTVNLTVQAAAAELSTPVLLRLEEMYVAFFNRVPDADGLEYWIGRFKAGETIDQIAESFYSAGVQYSELTGYSPGMSHGEFVDVVYRNVLGRAGGADAEGRAYWSGELAAGRATQGSLVSDILWSAHTFKGDDSWGWVADLLDNKGTVADRVAVQWGLNYNTPQEWIAQGMAIAAAVTPTDTDAAIALVGVDASHIDLIG